MRAMAAARLDVPSSAASEIEVDRSCTLCTSGKKHGKPRIAGVNFNMSQVNPLVVGAFSRNSSAVLGVDVETLDARLFSGFARLALSNEERSFYERAAQERPAPVLHLLSVALWTAKEAVLKATGHGLSVVPSLVRVQLTDALLDALELAMNEEVPGDLLGSGTPEPTALRVLTQDSLTARATFSAPQSSDKGDNQGSEAIERSFSLQWIPVALPDAENPEHAQKMLIALAVENPAGGEPAQVEAQLLPVATPLELKRLLTD
jgi:4'-phosphopantetheinyl transferase family protein